MDLDFVKDIGRQLAQVWRDIKTYQKFTVVFVALVLMGLLGVMVSQATSTHYVSLFPKDRLLISDAAEIKNYLDGLRVSYKLRGDTHIMVSESDVHKLRMDLAAVGLPKMNSGKGFELFDTNTWIKGEKELQVLEMRALMGQLETDIGQYDNIKSTNVILDLAPPRPFGGAMYKAKASVILTLMPGAVLSTSQLRAITYHIAGAVRGLQPNMVAISDTSGKLYQAIDPDGEVDLLRTEEIAVEERLKSKIDGLLGAVVGHGNYYSTVQVTMSREKYVQERKIYSGSVNGTRLGDPVIASVTEQGLQMSERERAELGTPGTNTEAVAGAVVTPSNELLNRDESRNATHREMAVPVDHLKINSTPGKIESISIGVLVDKTITIDDNADLPEQDLIEGKRNAEKLREEIESQLAVLTEGYGIRTDPAVDFVEFDKTKFNKKQKEESWSSLMENVTNTATILFVVLTVFGMFWTFNRFWRRHMMQPPSLETEEQEEEVEFSEEPTLVEVEAMVESIKMRFQNEPVSVVDAIREWIAEENNPEIPQI